MPRVAATFPAERPFTASSGPRRNALQLDLSSTSVYFRNVYFHHDSYQFTSRSSRPPPLTPDQLPRDRAYTLQDYDLRGGNALADLFIGGKLAISPITASTGHHVLGIKSRREEGARAREDNREVKGKTRVDFSGVGCAVRLADTVLIASTLTVAARVPNARPASRTATMNRSIKSLPGRRVLGSVEKWRQ